MCKVEVLVTPRRGLSLGSSTVTYSVGVLSPRSRALIQ